MKDVLNTHIIFVAGYPRSGTTWFSNLINSHSKVVYRHELIGRNYTMFGGELFDSIKYDNGLTDEQYSKAVEIIHTADVNTDKPPFFKKDMGLSKSPKLHHTFWICAKLFPFLRPTYNRLFRIRNDRGNFKILLKETRSTKNMQSMLMGLRVKDIVFLVRAPHGSIASNLNGITSGKMVAPTPESIEKWFSEHSDNPYVKSLRYEEQIFNTMTAVEFFAIDWATYHLEVLRLNREFTNANICFYEDFVNAPAKETRLLFKKVGLAYSDSVEQFIFDSSESQPLLKDSNSDYYSVYRNAAFKVDSWRDTLNTSEISLISKHTDDVYARLKNV
jgi:hypothetical protein